MQFRRQEDWGVLPFPPPGDLPEPGIEPVSPTLAGGFSTIGASWEAQTDVHDSDLVSDLTTRQ